MVVRLSDSAYHQLYQQENFKCLQEFMLPREESLKELVGFRWRLVDFQSALKLTF